ncbi:MAG: Ig-like domain repeat protein [Chloroflexota bacterium]
MNLLKFNPQKSKGQAVVEFAFVLPILLLVVYGLIETGRLLFIYSSVNNATRQAARYGSTSGTNNAGVLHYQDCDGIRQQAKASDFLNVINPADIVITYDRGPGTASYDTCNGSVDTGVKPSQGDRVVVSVQADYNTIVPNIVPILSRTKARGNPIAATSSRTLLLKVDIQPPKEITITKITSDQPDASVPGELVEVKVDVTGDKTAPTGTVEITGADQNCTITLVAGAGKISSGSCFVRFNSIGDKTITATYTGDAKHDPSDDTEDHTVWAPTTITLTTSPNPSLINTSATLSVSVTSAYGTPTGTVEVTMGGTSLCTITLSNGTGTCTYTFTSDGDKILTAAYNSDSRFFKPSNITHTHRVFLPGVTTTSITTSPSPSQVNQQVTITVNVTSTSTPTGTVAVTTGGTPVCNITLSGGTGTCTTTFSTVGTRTLTATYTPDSPYFLGSSGSVSHTVQLPATITTLTTTNTPPYLVGQTITLNVTVGNAPGGSTVTPTGTVTISGQSSGCATPITLVNGSGTCTVTFSTPGSKTLTATYSGDAGHAASTGTLTLNVTTSAVTGCNTVTLGLLRQSGGAMVVTINNPLTEFLQIANVSVTWNHDKGHQTGADKTLRLQSASLGSVFWTGNESGPTYTITPSSAIFIPPGSSTLTFTFHQVFDRWDDTEQVTINLSTPGCETVVLFQNRHE